VGSRKKKKLILNKNHPHVLDRLQRDQDGIERQLVPEIEIFFLAATIGAETGSPRDKAMLDGTGTLPTLSNVHVIVALHHVRVPVRAHAREVQLPARWLHLSMRPYQKVALASI